MFTKKGSPESYDYDAKVVRVFDFFVGLMVSF